MVLLKKQGAKRSAFLPVSVPFALFFDESGDGGLKRTDCARFYRTADRPDFTKCQRADVATTDGESLAQNLLAQLENPVRWVDIVRKWRQWALADFMNVAPEKCFAVWGVVLFRMRSISRWPIPPHLENIGEISVAPVAYRARHTVQPRWATFIAFAKKCTPPFFRWYLRRLMTAFLLGRRFINWKKKTTTPFCWKAPDRYKRSL